MNSGFTSYVTNLWREKPNIIVLFVAGLIIFLLLVIDTHLHRKKLKQRHRINHHPRR